MHVVNCFLFLFVLLEGYNLWLWLSMRISFIIFERVKRKVSHQRSKNTLVDRDTQQITILHIHNAYEEIYSKKARKQTKSK